MGVVCRVWWRCHWISHTSLYRIFTLTLWSDILPLTTRYVFTRAARVVLSGGVRYVFAGTGAYVLAALSGAQHHGTGIFLAGYVDVLDVLGEVLARVVRHVLAVVAFRVDALGQHQAIRNSRGTSLAQLLLLLLSGTSEAHLNDDDE